LLEPLETTLQKKLLLVKLAIHSLITAGLRDGSVDVIENIGIERTKGILAKAFFKILVVNPSDFNDLDANLAGSEPDLVLFTHSDIAPHRTSCS
jgi:tRNA U34 5-carboxymethylaminomethyl modifying GTPase MnmE/TrmE